jgi:hypothetical protein
MKKLSRVTLIDATAIRYKGRRFTGLDIFIWPLFHRQPSGDLVCLLVRVLILPPDMMSLYRGIVFLASIFLLFGAHVSADAVSDLQDKGRAAINAELAKSKTCTAAKLKVRKEWYVKI